MKALLWRLWSSEDGQALVEYALILSLIATATIASVLFLRGKIQTTFSTIGSSIENSQ